MRFLIPFTLLLLVAMAALLVSVGVVAEQQDRTNKRLDRVVAHLSRLGTGMTSNNEKDCEYGGNFTCFVRDGYLESCSCEYMMDLLGKKYQTEKGSE